MGEPRVARPHLALSLGAPSTTGQRPRRGGAARGGRLIFRVTGLLMLMLRVRPLLLRGTALRAAAKAAATSPLGGGRGGPSA